MAILLNNMGFENQPWADVFADELPDMPVHVWPEVPDPAQIKYAVVWKHPHGDLRRYPNLQAILLLGAGTDHIDAEPDLPKVPVVRLLDPDVGNDMAQYALYWAMHFHRRYEDYRQQAQRAEWQAHEVTRSKEFRVTVLGLGIIGQEVAQRIAGGGFCAQGWNRSPRQIEGVKTWHGAGELSEALQHSDVVVNCLPLNDSTRHLLNRQRLSALPKGAFLINISRGAVIDDDGLIELLNDGHVSGAALDCFAQEPLPQESPYWRMPNVYVTPHMSGSTYVKSASRPVVENIRRLEKGDVPQPIHLPPQHAAST
ncbi:MAG: glyoxylate/hydroxypyruvate reductase A [Gammaproteobacteria bacterium]|nr:glyoxylate/hydroxypyruvate reductase A [Gammaproteobacteria bacterium]